MELDIDGEFCLHHDHCFRVQSTYYHDSVYRSRSLLLGTFDHSVGSRPQRLRGLDEARVAFFELKVAQRRRGLLHHEPQLWRRVRV